MDSSEILATGGMGGATGVVIFIIYKLLQKGLRSRCCGYTVEVGLQTPKNIEVKVDEAHNNNSTEQDFRTAQEQRREGSSGGQDTSRKRSQEAEETNGECCSKHHFETTNPLSITIPKPLQ